MYVTSTNGKRTISVAEKTINRVIEHVSNNPGKTTLNYAMETGVAESTVNLLIEKYMLDMAAAGRIAVSAHGRKPEWYNMVPDGTVIPVVENRKKMAPVPMAGITDRQLRLDCRSLSDRFQQASTRKLSPRNRKRVWDDFSQRLNHVGSSYQATMNDLREAYVENENSQGAIVEMSMKMNDVLAKLHQLTQLVGHKTAA